MYNEFYNLKENPFKLTPSTRYLYLGEIHKEALALLTYGVVERKGFILLTGEVGTGKTTMVQALLKNLDQNVQYVYLSNPLLSAADFIDYLGFSVFKKKVHFKSKAEFLIEFERFLKDCLQHQGIFILLIDEAHKLSEDLLEEIRLLSNMEMADEKLVNIFLVGQPELNQKLRQPQCRALLQRISVRYHIEPLTLKETGEYIENRLRIAGARNGHRIFPGSTIKSVFEFSLGFPRMVNILCDNALLLGYSREKRTITPAMIKECHEDLKLDDEPTKDSSEKELDYREDLRSHPSWKGQVKWMLVVLAFLVGMAIPGTGLDVYRSLFPSGIFVDSSKTVNPPAEKGPALLPGKKLQKPNTEVEGSARSASNQAGTGPVQKTANQVPEVTEVEGSARSASNQAGTGPVQKTANQVPEVNKNAGLKGIIQKAGSSKIPPARVVIVKEGDTVTHLATSVYGLVNDNILAMIKRSNPDLANINLISIGQKIVFPPLKTANEAPTYTVYIASFAPIEAARKLFRQLSEEGYEAYILPFQDPEKGKIFRVTIGNFKDLKSASTLAEKILEKGISKSATPIQVDLK